MIEDKLKSVRERIRRAADTAGRNAADIVLVCVTKEANLNDISEAIKSGITDIGENRIQDFIAKYGSFDKRGMRWHFIGHLQTNKAKKAVESFDLIHSVDSLRLAERLQLEAQKINKMQSILLEVNVSRERTKYGLTPEAAGELVGNIGDMKNLMLLGLMTMAPYSDNPENSRIYFKRLRELRDGFASHNCDNINMKHLSMGMSGDFETAIEEGADIVRIGSAIFK